MHPANIGIGLGSVLKNSHMYARVREVAGVGLAEDHHRPFARWHYLLRRIPAGNNAWCVSPAGMPDMNASRSS